MQLAIFSTYDQTAISPPPGQLLKWIGNKQRFAAEIVSHFPREIGTYFEPFLGSGAVLATLAPRHGVATDVFGPLIEIWQTLTQQPERLKSWYRERWEMVARHGKVPAYERVRAAYNAKPNGADLLFLCRACYGGVVRFRKSDGHMSTPCGIHEPMGPARFDERVDAWHQRVHDVEVRLSDYRQVMRQASVGDMVYCDPPYSYSQSILYGAQAFDLNDLLVEIADCKHRGVNVALSIDGAKKTGDLFCQLEIPPGLFEQEMEIKCGRSMLKRFQMEGRTLEREEVTDRLLLTY